MGGSQRYLISEHMILFLNIILTKMIILLSAYSLLKWAYSAVECAYCTMIFYVNY